MSQSRELVVADDGPHPMTMTSTAATAAMGMMTDTEFQSRLALLKAGRDRVLELTRTLMTAGIDFGTVGNVTKPTLLKPGAELLDGLYGLVPDFNVSVSYGDGITSPPISAQVRCEQHLGSLDGPIVGVGHGACNSWERRYRYRKAKRSCPACGLVGALFRGSAESRLQGRYWCGPRDGGCGETFEPDDPRITSQALGDVDNPDPFELENTVVKMAEKRGHVDATLRTTHTSGVFTQDIEDFKDGSDTELDAEARAAAEYAASQAAGGQASQPPAAPVERPAQPPQEPRHAPQPAQGPDEPPLPPEPVQRAAQPAAPTSNRRTVASSGPAPEPPPNGPAQAYRPVTTDPAKCPKHNRPWRSGARGWYCSAKDDSGPRGYCTLAPGPAWSAAQERTSEPEYAGGGYGG